MVFPPRIDILYIEGCPHWREALELTRSAARLAGAAEVDVIAVEVSSPEQALRLGFAGSPTILVDGVDPFAGAATGNLACRLFRTPHGPSGLPDSVQLAQAIRAAMAGRAGTPTA
ncbi:hypothetical protein GCM10012320_18550 [Sinomonas cellulolyticus]|jgi:hypothetical protein|uniref:Thioredoxin family protein n=1 Tax=Sinomonas cellulolyticus TaxID=2801916 RepID=A0ABS1K6C7_9MICC|nr:MULTISPECIES: hypothetical protein [Sinomonas]MBL0707235.1 thioredoxin family protein [Sinomonas cellulolyticus]GHG50175.1 hypothetical protein GCM10012320_18550 [Sinomonas sp. KCTC 49339]